MKKLIVTSAIVISNFIVQGQAFSEPMQAYQNPTGTKNANPGASGIMNVTTHTFQQVLASTSTPIVLVFSASWCKPCQAMKPVVDELAREMQGVTFLRADFDANPELAQNFHVDSIPAVLFIRRDGYIADRNIGFAAKQQLKDKIQAFISSQQQ